MSKPETKADRVRALLARPITWPCHVSAVEMIATEEDCRLKAYRCPAGVWTIGWAETEGVKAGMRWTQEVADERFREALQEWTAGVEKALGGAYANDHQMAAFLCLAYNIGLPAFQRSTVLRLHKRGDYAGAARAFALWNKRRDPKTGQLVEDDALTARRAREAARYLTPVDDETVEQRLPQAVAAESSLARSPIAQAGAVTATVGAASAAGQLADVLQPAQDLLGQAAPLAAQASQIAGSAGISTQIVVPLALLAAGVVVMYWRWKQRDGGWA